MLSLNAEWTGLVLSRLNRPDFDDSSWEALSDGRSGWGVSWEVRGAEREVGGELRLKCNKNSTNSLDL